MDISSILL